MDTGYNISNFITIINSIVFITNINIGMMIWQYFNNPKPIHNCILFPNSRHHRFQLLN